MQGIASLRGYRRGGVTSPDPEEAKRQRLWQLMAERRDAPDVEDVADYIRMSEQRIGEGEEEFGPPVDDPRLRKMMPLVDSLQTLLPPAPWSPAASAFPKLRTAFGRQPGYEETVPVSFRAEGPEGTWGMYSGNPPGSTGGYQEKIDIFPSSKDLRHADLIADQSDEDLRHTAMHEFGHAYDYRDPEAKTGWMSPELREAIYSAKTPFDVPGRFGTDEPGQRYADLVADAIGFLQTSKNSKIDPDHTRQYLEDRPYIGSIVEELLQTPTYREHPINTGTLGSGYVSPDTAHESLSKMLPPTRELQGSLDMAAGTDPHYRSRFDERYRRDQ